MVRIHSTPFAPRLPALAERAPARVCPPARVAADGSAPLCPGCGSAAGRAAVVQFLRYHGVLAISADGAAGVDALDGAGRAFGPAAANVPRPEYDGAWSPMAHGRATLRLKPIVE